MPKPTQTKHYHSYAKQPDGTVVYSKQLWAGHDRGRIDWVEIGITGPNLPITGQPTNYARQATSGGIETGWLIGTDAAGRIAFCDIEQSDK